MTDRHAPLDDWPPMGTAVAPSAVADAADDDEEIRVLVARLARPHVGGGRVVERASLLAAGADFRAVMAWIEAHGGNPEPLPAPRAEAGLHRARSGGSSVAGAAPRRFILPDAALRARDRANATDEEIA